MRVASKLSSLIFHLSTCLLLTSCSEVLYLTVEQMVPPKVVPSQDMRSIGVVSNFSQHNVVVASQNAIIIPCDADTIKEKIALLLAEAGIMDRVVVLDSLLYHPDSTTTHILSQHEVNTLCQLLEVEAIYSIDYACLIYNPAARFISRPLNAYLCSRIYTSDTDSIRGTSILDKSTLDYWIYNTDEIAELLPKVPTLLAQNAVGSYLPSWTERERVFYYDRLCYPLREARVYVKEANWPAAAEQWRTLAQSKHRAYRYMAAYNMALYYEMTDSIDQALVSLDQAEQIMKDDPLLQEYREVLITRKKEVETLEAVRE